MKKKALDEFNSYTTNNIKSTDAVKKVLILEVI